MPNIASVRAELFAGAGFAKGNPWVIGYARVDSPKSYGWVALAKEGDMYKSLIDKTGPHTHIGTGFDLLAGKDFAKAQGTLPPGKHNDKTFADLLTLKFNIVLSQLGITRRGLGELRLNIPSSPFHNMILTRVAAKGDSMMTFHTKYGASLYTSLDSALVAINGAFSAALDTTSWGDSLRLTGVKRLVDVPFLGASGMAASSIEPVKDAAVLAYALPSEMHLEQNFPNPFNPVTTIQFALPDQATVSLVVYNMLGQEVARLVDQQLLDAGVQEVSFNASALASGVYFYRITADITTLVDGENDAEISTTQTLTQVKKMMLIK